MKDVFVNVFIVQNNHSSNWILVDTGLKTSAPKIKHMIAEVLEPGASPMAIIMTHGHFDHVADTSLIAQNTGAMVVANWELYNWCRKIGIDNSQPLNPGGKWEFDFGTVHCVAAQHSNSLPDGSYGGSACGFVLLTEEGNFYYSGDTALTLDMKLIGRYGCLDFAVLPIGDALTMGVEDAIELAEWLDIEQVVGVLGDPIAA